jgi:probable regulatory protein lysR family
VGLFQKYKILSDNHPVYWKKVKQEISEIVPESQFVSIKDIAVTEKLIEMGQGISYLPLYLKMTLNPNIATRIPEEISIPLSFTYIMTRKNSEAIELFKNKFKEFIVFEQNKVNF